MKIGFIGLGNMGAPMARNLVSAGHQLSGFDISASIPPGIEGVASAAQAAAEREVVILMLPSGQSVRNVADEIMPALSAGTIVIDSSTIDIESARAVAQQCDEAGFGFLDAPVSGGVDGAEKGKLTFMIGGASATFARVEALFSIMGARAVHCGDAGAGQAAKICNNMILGATMIATCEGFALADALGLQRERLFDVVSTSSGFSWAMNTYCPAPGIGPDSPADHAYRPGFMTDLMVKDLRLAQQAATATDTATPICAHAARLFGEFLQDNGSGRDFSAIFESICKH